jgi:hypothetical protein
MLATPLLAGAGGDGGADPRASLSPAQIVLFETPHLAAAHPPVRLDYAFRREEAPKEPIVDTIRLEVRATPGDEAKRDVTPEFLTGPHAIHYPPAHDFGGNPLLVFALDRDARELSAATGGTPQWFRNRFRQTLASAADLRQDTVEFDGRRMPATVIGLSPYTGEPRAGRYQDRRYTFVLAEAVPGWFHTIRTDLPATASGEGAVVETIVFAGTSPLPEGAG